MEVKVGDGPRTPYYYDSDGRKEAFIRSGNQSVPAPKHILDGLILKGQNTTFDELPSKYSISAECIDINRVFYSAEIGKRHTKKDNGKKYFVKV